MFQVNTKVQRSEGSKPSTEVYLVEAISLTDIDIKVNTEFKDIQVSIPACKEMKFTGIFENGEGTFFVIKILVEDLESKTSKEVFVQEAKDYADAEERFKQNVDYGEITDLNLTNYMGILR